MASVAEQLKELAALYEKGLLTREEFEEEKQALRASRNTSSLPPITVSATQPQIGETIGAYRILGLLGEGGMGIVYRARHRNDAMAKRQGGDVALKALHAQYATNPTFQERFEREATVGLTLDHPGVVKVHDLVVDGGHLALAMELVSGRELAQIIGRDRGPIPWEEALPQFVALLDAVGYAHSQGVIHRDLKPENVMLTDEGTLKVLDFGIAKQEGSGKTKTGTGMGTVDYMAPEQYLDAKSVDHRADIYALGMTLYEMLAGRLSWEPEASEFDVLDRKRSGAILPPTSYYPDIPPWLVDCVMTALSVDKSARFNSCAAFGERLKKADQAAASQPAASPPQEDCPPHRHQAAQLPSLRFGDKPTPSPTKEKEVSQDAPTKAPPLKTPKEPAKKRRAGWLIGGLGLALTVAATVLLGIGLTALGVWYFYPGKWESEVAMEDGSPQALEAAAACDWSNMQACADLGTMYSKGKGVYENDMMAVELFEKAVSSDDIGDYGRHEAIFSLGRMYSKGEGVARDDAKALELLTSACDYSLGSFACTDLGDMYKLGRGVARDYAKAVELYDTGCMFGAEPKACSNLAYMYTQGWGVDKDDSAAAEWFRKACDAGYGGGCVWLGYLYENGRGVEKLEGKALVLYEQALLLSGKACDNGELEECAYLGTHYNNGVGVSEDETHAAELYRKACDGSILWACSELGSLYENGNGVTEDELQAVTLYRKACEGGWGYGCRSLAGMYFKGEGIAEDKSEAARLYGEACDAGVENACDDLGAMHYNGQGIPEDHAKARTFYRKACSLGSMTGCKSLGIMFHNGEGGPQSYPEAAQWYQKACDGGSADGCTYRSKLREWTGY